jgi:hypothetical protein
MDSGHSHWLRAGDKSGTGWHAGKPNKINDLVITWAANLTSATAPQNHGAAHDPAQSDA